MHNHCFVLNGWFGEKEKMSSFTTHYPHVAINLNDFPKMILSKKTLDYRLLLHRQLKMSFEKVWRRKKVLQIWTNLANDMRVNK